MLPVHLTHNKCEYIIPNSDYQWGNIKSNLAVRREHSMNQKDLQLNNFGVIAGKDTVAGGHSSIGRNHTVISSGNRDTGPA